MVEVMKIMAISFKRSHACTAALSAPSLQQATADPCLRGRLLDTHGQVLVSLLWGHCSFLLGLGAQKIFVYALQESVSPVLCKFCGSLVGFMATSSKKAYPGLLHPEPLPLRQATADPYLHRRHSNSSASVSMGSLAPGVH